MNHPIVELMALQERTWLALGFGGQALFFARFLVQWIHSERLGRSVIPIEFWYCSMGGGAITLTYSLYRLDPVFIAGQCIGIFVYSRNLYLIFRERRRSVEPPRPGTRP